MLNSANLVAGGRGFKQARGRRTATTATAAARAGTGAGTSARVSAGISTDTLIRVGPGGIGSGSRLSVVEAKTVLKPPLLFYVRKPGPECIKLYRVTGRRRGRGGRGRAGASGVARRLELRTGLNTLLVILKRRIYLSLGRKVIIGRAFDL